MNFHKTIGFLAALLLMVGLGAPDSFAQTPTTKITLNRSNYVLEGNSVVVTVTLAPAPRANTTVSVTINGANTAVGLNSRYEVERLGDHDDDDDTPDQRIIVASHNDNRNGNEDQVFKVVVGTDGTGTERLYIEEGTLNSDASARVPTFYYSGASLILTIADDITESIPQGQENPLTYPNIDDVDGTTTAADVTDDAKKLPIRDKDQSLVKGTLKVTVNRPSFDVGATANQTAEVIVALPAAPGTGNSVTLGVAVTGGATVDVSAPTISGTATKTTVTVTLDTDNDDEAGTVKVTASANNYNSASIDIPIIDRDAEDAQGFRVTMVNPNGAWVGFGSKKVKVKVTRLHNTYSYPWASFKKPCGFVARYLYPH